MQLTSKFHKGIRFLLCVIDIYSNYAWVVPLKNKNDETIVSAFQNVFMIQWENQKRYGYKKVVTKNNDKNNAAEKIIRTLKRQNW